MPSSWVQNNYIYHLLLWCLNCLFGVCPGPSPSARAGQECLWLQGGVDDEMWLSACESRSAIFDLREEDEAVPHPKDRGFVTTASYFTLDYLVTHLLGLRWSCPAGLLEKPALLRQHPHRVSQRRTQKARGPSLLCEVVPCVHQGWGCSPHTDELWCAPSSRDGGLFLQQPSPSPAALPIKRRNMCEGRSRECF